MSDFRRARIVLTLRFVVLATCLLVITSGAVWVGVRVWEIGQRDAELERQAAWLRAFVSEPQEDAEILEELAEIAVAAEEPVGTIIYDAYGKEALTWGILGPGFEAPIALTDRALSLVLPDGAHARALWTQLPPPHAGWALLVCELDRLDTYLRSLAVTLLLGDLLGLAVAAALGWHFAGVALRPVQDSYERMRSFLADASHEMRTPLTAILGEAETVLRRERDSAEYREALSYCAAYTRQLTEVVESVLELSRADAGVPSLRIEDLDVAALARETAEMVRRRFGPLPALSVHAPEALWIRADPTLVRRALVNLIENAAVHAKGATRIEIRIEASADRDEVTLSVTDDGQGIAPEDLPHVFERFYRGRIAAHERSGRNGLGLAIVDSIAHAHGGTVRVHSEGGKGAAFTLTLPARR